MEKTYYIKQKNKLVNLKIQHEKRLFDCKIKRIKVTIFIILIIFVFIYSII